MQTEASTTCALPAFWSTAAISKSPSAGWHNRFVSGACTWTALDSGHHRRSATLKAQNQSPHQISQNGQARVYLRDSAALHRQRRCPCPSSRGCLQLPQRDCAPRGMKNLHPPCARQRPRRPVVHTQCCSRATRLQFCAARCPWCTFLKSNARAELASRQREGELPAHGTNAHEPCMTHFHSVPTWPPLNPRARSGPQAASPGSPETSETGPAGTRNFFLYFFIIDITSYRAASPSCPTNPAAIMTAQREMSCCE